MRLLHGTSRRALARWAMGFVVACVLLAVARIAADTDWDLLTRSFTPVPSPGVLALADHPPVKMPDVVPGWAARLKDNVVVIGVTAGGRHRAYVLAALAPQDRHVINDVVGGEPVTVTFCDRLNCARVFTDPAGTQPLDVSMGGFDGRPDSTGMLLALGQERFRQDTGESLAGGPAFPYPACDFERLTWREWRAAHPDTDVYTGEPPAAD